MTKVITRFAPSPTGYLHIGGARTALFNYLFAKHHGGEYKLRIEDTDKERNTPEAVDKIFSGLEWLGIQNDGEPVYQSSRYTRHQEIVEEMLINGSAYIDPTSPEQLEALRLEWAAKSKNPYKHRPKWRDFSYVPGYLPKSPYVVRLKAPTTGATEISDLVLGDKKVNNLELDDMVLLRSDGTPTYMLAVVVDDHDMGVTHVIRGNDHLNNTFRQMPIYTAMGWTPPEFAHIPLIHDASGKKLSKRTHAASVDDFRDMGILPEAMVNYLMKLGWSHGDDEIIAINQAIEWFDIKDVNKSASRFDQKKLDSVNRHYVHNHDDQKLAELIVDNVPNSNIDKLIQSMPIIKMMSKNLVELKDNAWFLFNKPEFTGEQREIIESNKHYLMTTHAAILELNDNWTIQSLSSMMSNVSDQLGLTDKWVKTLGKPLRTALTGKPSSPNIVETMWLLGSHETIERLSVSIWDS
jgi:glutamyl-tRNA synthetase